MQELKVIGVENGALLAASEAGERFLIPIDEVLQSRLRQTVSSTANSTKLSPREVQAHIRAGMSAEDVASVTGADLEFVRRFEGPVVAEREYIVASALAVPVHTGTSPDFGAHDPATDDSTFGSAIRERLASLTATGERWASWKEPGGGWIVKLAFSADGIDHDARWGFEPKKNALTPMGSEAVALSAQGGVKDTLIPRLRAVSADTKSADSSRFDSGAFSFKESLAEDSVNDTAPIVDLVPYSRPAGVSAAVSKAAITRADEPRANLSETADLLESLRRRRSERDAAASVHAPLQQESAVNPLPRAGLAALAPLAGTVEGSTAHAQVASADGTAADVTEMQQSVGTDEADGLAGSHSQVAFVAASVGTTPEPALEDASERPGSKIKNAWANQAATGAPRTNAPGTRRGRVAMPSWDEIVFGARTDEDPS
jgi:hypothetical protein